MTENPKNLPLFEYASYNDDEFNCNITLRDLFAGQAMAAAMTNNKFMDGLARGVTDDMDIVQILAMSAFAQADAMLAARQS